MEKPWTHHRLHGVERGRIRRSVMTEVEIMRGRRCGCIPERQRKTEKHRQKEKE